LVLRRRKPEPQPHLVLQRGLRQSRTRPPRLCQAPVAGLALDEAAIHDLDLRAIADAKPIGNSRATGWTHAPDPVTILRRNAVIPGRPLFQDGRYSRTAVIPGRPLFQDERHFQRDAVLDDLAVLDLGLLRHDLETRDPAQRLRRTAEGLLDRVLESLG